MIQDSATKMSGIQSIDRSNPIMSESTPLPFKSTPTMNIHILTHFILRRLCNSYTGKHKTSYEEYLWGLLDSTIEVVHLHEAVLLRRQHLEHLNPRSPPFLCLVPLLPPHCQLSLPHNHRLKGSRESISSDIEEDFL